MKNSEKDDPVWKLLGAAREVKTDPFFSRNVVREVRKMQGNGGDGIEREGVLGTILSYFRQPALAGVAAAVAILALVYLGTETASNSSIADSATPSDAPISDVADFDLTDEIESIGYLGELMAISDPAELDDAALADLSLLASR